MVEQNAVQQTNTVREAVGLFKDSHEMQETIDELERSGFPRYEISVLEENQDDDTHTDDGYMSVESLEDSPYARRKINITREDLGFVQGTILCAGIFFGVILAISMAAMFGWSSPFSVAFGGVLGALFGGVIAHLFSNSYNEKLSRQMQKGGLLLWVNTPNKEKEVKACSIMNKHHAQDVHIHDVMAKFS